MFNQSQIAKLTGLSQGTISRLHRGHNLSHKSREQIQGVIKYLNALKSISLKKQNLCSLLRERYKLEKHEIANSLGITSNKLTRLENGTSDPTENIKTIRLAIKELDRLIALNLMDDTAA